MLFQSLMYPVLVLLFSLSEDESTKFAMVSTLTPMFVGSAPLLTVNNLVREDKNTGALRALTLASVRPLEYITAISLFMLSISGVTSILMAIAGGIAGIEAIYFFAASMIGCLLTVMLGCSISLRRNGRTNAVMFINIISILNGLIPMLELFYPSVTTVTKFWYTQQVKNIIVSIFAEDMQGLPFSFGVIIATLALFSAAFVFAYRKNKIFSQE